MNTITCKHCGKELEIDEALKHSVREQVQSEEREKHKQAIQEAIESAKKEALDKNSIETEDLKKQIDELKNEKQQFKEEELKLREKTRNLEEKQKDFELEVARKTDEKIKETLEKERERHRFKELELEKKLLDVQKANEEMRIKLEQGSQQTQGEVLELDFESSLTSEFPDDEIIPIAKGRSGGDIRQVVKTPKGTVCGTILWETKRAKGWLNDWPEKLKSDLRAEKANVPIIVTNVFPRGFKSSLGIYEGVWLVGYSLSIQLAQLMRQRLIDVAREKYFAQNKDKDGTKDLLYEYIIGHEFGQVLESQLEVYDQLIKQVNVERVAFEKQWKERLENADKLMRSTTRLVGSIQGKLGSSATLQVKGIDMLTLGSGDEE